MNWVLSALAWYKDDVKCFELLDSNFPSALFFIMSKITESISQDNIVLIYHCFPKCEKGSNLWHYATACPYLIK